VSRANGVYADNILYLGLFKPDMSTSNWLGNLKKYKLSPNFDALVGADGTAATDADGNFLATSKSFWSAAADGTTVDAGGAGAALVSMADSERKLYTYIDDANADTDLTAGRNAFLKTNTILTTTMLAADDADHRNAIIDDIRGFDADGDKKKWVMADVLHSAPQVVLYDTDGKDGITDDDGSVIYLGTNGGVMHAFWDKGATVEELWGFVPPSQLDRLKLLSQASVHHNYFLDGPPSVYQVSGSKYLAFGERRGGRNYNALDISTYNKPKWQYEIGEDILGGASAEQLGQSWGRPQYAKIATGSATTAEVLLLPGGYDTNQDKDLITYKDTRGRAVFSVTATGGSLGAFKFYNDATTGQNSDMEYSIVDLVGVDTVGDELVNSIYAPDLGGGMFAFTDADHNGTWQKYKLFDASTGTTLNTRRKIFYAPAVINITGDPLPTDGTHDIQSGEMIFFGTGDRADPDEVQVTNRFYAVKNYWWDSDFTTMTESNLHNATDNDIVQGTADEKAAAVTEIIEKMGWYIDLEDSGEKIVGTPVVFNGVVYFTTYTPPASGGETTTGDCDATDAAVGTARLYGLDYRDGRSVHDDWSETPDTDAETGEEVGTGGKNDRWIDIGGYIPAPPVIIVHKGYARLYVGAGGKFLVIEPKEAPEMKMYYWRDTQP
jgi:type IV pilus assembly protein PilY1